MAGEIFAQCHVQAGLVARSQPGRQSKVVGVVVGDDDAAYGPGVSIEQA